jgi:hypothetical protein
MEEPVEAASTTFAQASSCDDHKVHSSPDTGQVVSDHCENKERLQQRNRDRLPPSIPFANVGSKPRFFAVKHGSKAK